MAVCQRVCWLSTWLGLCWRSLTFQQHNMQPAQTWPSSRCCRVQDRDRCRAGGQLLPAAAQQHQEQQALLTCPPSSRVRALDCWELLIQVHQQDLICQVFSITYMCFLQWYCWLLLTILNIILVYLAMSAHALIKRLQLCGALGRIKNRLFGTQVCLKECFRLAGSKTGRA